MIIRKHYPETGDIDGVLISDVLNMDSGIMRSDYILSKGVGDADPVALCYEPKGISLDKIPGPQYEIQFKYGEYRMDNGTDNFLEIILRRIERRIRSYRF